MFFQGYKEKGSQGTSAKITNPSSLEPWNPKISTEGRNFLGKTKTFYDTCNDRLYNIYEYVPAVCNGYVPPRTA